MRPEEIPLKGLIFVNDWCELVAGVNGRALEAFDRAHNRTEVPPLSVVAQGFTLQLLSASPLQSKKKSGA